MFSSCCNIGRSSSLIAAVAILLFPPWENPSDTVLLSCCYLVAAFVFQTLISSLKIWGLLGVRVDVGGVVKLNLPTNIALYFVAMWQVASEGQSDKMVSDMEIHMRQKCRSEFTSWGKNCTYWYSLTFAEHLWRSVDVSTMRWCVMYFSNDTITATVEL